MIVKIIISYIKCHLYLLFEGMWKGECMLTKHLHNKLIFIGTATGSFYRNNIEIKRTFYQNK